MVDSRLVYLIEDLTDMILSRGATANLSQARPNILTQIFLTGCFLQERIETQNLGKAQAFGALPAVAVLNQDATVT